MHSALRELLIIHYIEMYSSPRELQTIHYIKMHSALRELQTIYYIEMHTALRELLIIPYIEIHSALREPPTIHYIEMHKFKDSHNSSLCTLEILETCAGLWIMPSPAPRAPTSDWTRTCIYILHPHPPQPRTSWTCASPVPLQVVPAACLKLTLSQINKIHIDD